MVHQLKWWVRDRNAAPPVEEPEPEPDLESLTKAELVSLAEAKDLDTSGTKAELLERLSDG